MDHGVSAGLFSSKQHLWNMKFLKAFFGFLFTRDKMVNKFYMPPPPPFFLLLLLVLFFLLSPSQINQSMSSWNKGYIHFIILSHFWLVFIHLCNSITFCGWWLNHGVHRLRKWCQWAGRVGSDFHAVVGVHDNILHIKSGLTSINCIICQGKNPSCYKSTQEDNSAQHMLQT